MKQNRKDRLAQLALAQKHSDELVAKHIAERRVIVSARRDRDEDTPGQRAADAVARFGGSWTFIVVFLAVLVAWVVVNSIILAGAASKAFDPYPYILLNLFLSMLASLQAPVILMSQNRQAEKDRMTAQNDYEVNLKAELEIMALHEKVDALKAELEIMALHKKIDDLQAMQTEQTRLLAKFMESGPAT